jgi:hypothetical protein
VFRKSPLSLGAPVDYHSNINPRVQPGSTCLVGCVFIKLVRLVFCLVLFRCDGPRLVFRASWVVWLGAGSRRVPVQAAALSVAAARPSPPTPPPPIIFCALLFVWFLLSLFLFVCLHFPICSWWFACVVRLAVAWLSGRGWGQGFTLWPPAAYIPCVASHA